MPKTPFGETKLGGEFKILVPEDGLCRKSSPSLCLSGVPASLGNPNSPPDGLCPGNEVYDIFFLGGVRSGRSWNRAWKLGEACNRKNGVIAVYDEPEAIKQTGRKNQIDTSIFTRHPTDLLL